MKVVDGAYFVVIAGLRACVPAAVFCAVMLVHPSIDEWICRRLEAARAAVAAGDTTVNQASWWLRDRMTVSTQSFVTDEPWLDIVKGFAMLSAVMAAIVLALRVPCACLAGAVARRAIRRDAIKCDPALARRIGRRVYLRGFLTWSVAGAVVAALIVALVAHLRWWDFRVGRSSRGVSLEPDWLYLAIPVVFLLIDGVFSVRYARRLVTGDIKGRQRLCTWCGYDVTSTPGRCPECGRSVGTSERDVGVRLFVRPPQARRAPVLVGLGMVFCALSVWGMSLAFPIRGRLPALISWDALVMRRSNDHGICVLFQPGATLMVQRPGMRAVVHKTAGQGWADARVFVLVLDDAGSVRERAEMNLVDLLNSRTPINMAGLSVGVWMEPPGARRRVLGDWLVLPRDVYQAALMKLSPSDLVALWMTKPGDDWRLRPETSAR